MSAGSEFERMVRDFERDPGLEERAQDILSRLVETGEARGEVESMALVARELGYDVKAADVERYVAEREEASDVEFGADGLEKVAGGFNWCFASYCCYAAWKRNNNNEESAACLKDYCCITVMHESLVVTVFEGFAGTECGIGRGMC